jgi:hypothetical protein
MKDIHSTVMLFRMVFSHIQNYKFGGLKSVEEGMKLQTLDFVRSTSHLCTGVNVTEIYMKT